MMAVAPSVVLIVIRMKLQYLPNYLTCLRFLLVAPILLALFNQHYEWAFYLFLAAGVTDALDGLLARVYGWTSRFGAMADPLADKILLMSSFITLGWLQQIPLWLVAVVVARDIWIMSGGLAYRFLIGRLDFMPSGVSKINTFLQILLVGVLLIHLSFIAMPAILLTGIIYAVFLTSITSMLHYTWVWSKKAIGSQKVQQDLYQKTQQGVI